MGGAAGNWLVEESGCFVVLGERCCAIVEARLAASAPVTRPSKVCPYSTGVHVSIGKSGVMRDKRTRRTTNVGTLSTSKLSEMSDCASASTWSVSRAGYLRASSCTTSFICLHGSAHGAQKLMSETRCRSVESSSWKCSGELMS